MKILRMNHTRYLTETVKGLCETAVLVFIKISRILNWEKKKQIWSIVNYYVIYLNMTIAINIIQYSFYLLIRS